MGISITKETKRLKTMLLHWSIAHSSFYNMLKVPEHQVAGHLAIDGKLGPLVDDSGRFYKPLQGDGRVNFWNHRNPSIMDVKIGSRTWYPEASDNYIQKCLEKDRRTTTVSLGFRIAGLQLYGGKESGYWRPGRKEVQSFTVYNVRSILRRFVSSNSSIGNENSDCSFAPSIYGGSAGILEQLLELKAWFEDQTIYHFHSCSLLILFDKESVSKGSASVPEIKLIDFAHVVEGKGVIDHNFLGGLCSLIKFVSDVLSDSKESSIKDCVESEKPGICTDNGNCQ
ncbi:hypothetical protein V6Z11_D12G221200 [Gossypium hirsutum]